MFTPSANVEITLPSAASYASTTHSKFLTIVNTSNNEVSFGSSDPVTDAGGYAVLGPGAINARPADFGNPSSSTHYNNTVTLRAVYDSSASTYRWYEVANTRN